MNAGDWKFTRWLSCIDTLSQRFVVHYRLDKRVVQDIESETMAESVTLFQQTFGLAPG